MADTTRGAELESAIDALYEGPLDAFTATRNALAAERRKAGDRDAAHRVKALAKPTATAWAVNQVWWNHRPALERLLDAGERQRAAHRAFAEGQASDIRAAGAERQQAVDAVVDLAVAALGGARAVTPDVRHRLAGTVEALASGGLPVGIAPGRLTRELQPSGLEAFGALAGLATAAAEAGPRPQPVLVKAAAQARAEPLSSDRESRAREARLKKIEDARARMASVEAALEAATREVAERGAEEQEARAALEAAAARVAELEAALEEAGNAEREAHRRWSSATKAVSEAEMMRARTARDVAAARRQLDEAEEP